MLAVATATHTTQNESLRVGERDSTAEPLRQPPPFAMLPSRRERRGNNKSGSSYKRSRWWESR
jgi:hypothetical protein